jgi:hypothetical protein
MMNHDVYVFCVSYRRRLDSVYLDHDAAANEFVRDLLSGRRSSNLLECADQSKKTLFKHSIDGTAFLGCLVQKLLKCQHK